MPSFSADSDRGLSSLCNLFMPAMAANMQLTDSHMHVSLYIGLDSLETPRRSVVVTLFGGVNFNGQPLLCVTQHTLKYRGCALLR